MNKSNYNALNELHNTLRCGVPADEYSQSINDKEVLKIIFESSEGKCDGVSIEDLLTVAYAKLASYNRELPCRENSVALTKIEEAIMWLANRKAEREARGVYGTEEK